MIVNNCVITVKQSILSRGGRAARLARKGDATARRLIQADAEQQRTVDEVCKTLRQHKIAFTQFSARDFSVAEKNRINKADLVITIGGDGTALGTAHYITQGAMIAVNSAPGDSIGHFCSVHRGNFTARFLDLLEDRWKPFQLTRLSLTLDEKPIRELALNDALIAQDCPAATTRYILQIGEQQEEHRSSGIWISTAAGSTAGIRSAGGKVMPRGSDRLQYLVRELYREPERSYALTRGFINKDEELIVASKMQKSHIYLDGAKTTYEFPFGMRAGIKRADWNLRIFLN